MDFTRLDVFVYKYVNSVIKFLRHFKSREEKLHLQYSNIGNI